MSGQRSHLNGIGTKSIGAVLTAVLALGGCSDSPFAPEAAPTADAPALQAAFLIGQSPLVPRSGPTVKTRRTTDGSVSHELEMTYEVALPGTAEGSGAYLIRTSADFYATVDPKGDPVATVDPRDDPVAAIDPKDDPRALVVIALPIDDASWHAIEKAAPKAGDLVDVVVRAELVFAADDGIESTLHGETTTGHVDPKVDPAR